MSTRGRRAEDRVVARSVTPSWGSAAPELEGMDASVLEALHRELARGVHGHVDCMLVIRGGRILFERLYPREYARLFRRQPVNGSIQALLRRRRLGQKLGAAQKPAYNRHGAAQNQPKQQKRRDNPSHFPMPQPFRHHIN